MGQLETPFARSRVPEVQAIQELFNHPRLRCKPWWVLFPSPPFPLTASNSVLPMCKQSYTNPPKTDPSLELIINC